MTLTLPETKFTESELKEELAVWLYASQKVTLIQAADIAGVGFFEFQGLLKDRKIPQNYGIENLEDDMRTLRELKNR